MKTDTPTPAASRRSLARAGVPVLTVLCSLLALFTTGCSSHESRGSGAARGLVGTWQGTLHDAGDQRIVMKVSKRPNGNWTAVVYDVDGRAAGLPVRSVTVKGAAIAWSLAAPRFGYEG